jgi:histidyl-tRNA synthetase
MADAPRLIDRLPQEDLDHFAEVQDLLQAAGLSYTVDTTLVRGLDYYTRTLFEFQSGALEAAQNTLGGGGRYDGLAEAIGGPPTPGMGWAAGVERMLMASTQPPPVSPPVHLYVAYEPGHKAAAFKLASDARLAGHSTRLELAGRSVKGQLKQASRSGARYVAIFGDEGVQLRDREGGEDKLVAPETVMHHIRGSL